MVNITEPKMASYLHSKAKKNGVPLAGNFELTSRCNFNCPMCYVHDNSGVDSLSTDEWIKLTDEACENGMLFLLFTGGEPLIKNDFEKIYTHAHEKGLIVSLNTNGSLCDGYFELFEKYPPMRINISLYGSCSDGYINQCGVDCFDKVIYNIKKLKEMSISIKLNAVITKRNCEDIKNIIALSKSLEIPIQVTPYCYPRVRLNSAFAENEARLSPEEAGKYSVMGDLALYGEDEFIKKARRSELNLSYNDDDCSLSCRAGSSSFWITHDGKMRACAMMNSPSVDLKSGSFMSAWQSVREQTANLRMPEECLKCPDRSFCKACAAMCKCETGSTDKKPEYVCRMIRSIRLNTREFIEKTENSHED